MSSFTFGTPATQPAAGTVAGAPPAFSFGAPTTAAAAPGSLFGAATGAATGGLAFGKPAATTSVPASLNFGTTTTSMTPFSSGGGTLFGKPAATTAAAMTTLTPAPPFVGLGGVSTMQPKAGDAKDDNIKAKETQVPDEIAKTVDALKAYIKAQKTIASDIGRTSTTKLSNVSSEINRVQWNLQEIANNVQANYMQIKLLRKETSKTIQALEMAQRTQDTPAGLQHENSAPFQYFLNVVEKYEQDLNKFRQQISLIEKHMNSLANPQSISPEDLKRGFTQINECFVSLAGRLHEIHQKVEVQKEQFINLRKYRLRDGKNLFAELDKPERKEESQRVTMGPSAFSTVMGMSSLSFGKTSGNTTTANNTTLTSGK